MCLIQLQFSSSRRCRLCNCMVVWIIPTLTCEEKDKKLFLDSIIYDGQKLVKQIC